jgi:hypothetical protein
MQRHTKLTARLSKIVLEIGKMAGAVAAVLGIVYGAIEYEERKHQGRVDQSLRLFDKFNSTPFTTYRETINKVVTENVVELRAAARDVEELSRFVLAMVRNNRVEPHLWLVMDFFDGVAVCIKNNLCDANTAHQLLAPRAQELHETFYQYIQSQRLGPSTRFALGLETLAVVGLQPASPRGQSQAARSP